MGDGEGPMTKIICNEGELITRIMGNGEGSIIKPITKIMGVEAIY